MTQALEFHRVNIDKQLQTCIDFRKDAWIVSYGSDTGFCEYKTIEWIKNCAAQPAVSFIHVCQGGQLIGQVEFNSNITTSTSEKAGYIYLLYLIPEKRGLGLGQIIHDYTLAQLINNHCVGAMLRYISGNLRAEQFYLKNNWYKVGKLDDNNTQLMRNDLLNNG